jgi:hypothetical protein
MALSSKYFYIRAIFFLPVSIGLLVAGIKGLSTNLNDYTRYEGVVEKMDYTKVRLAIRHDSHLVEAISLKLKNHNERFITTITDNIRLIYINVNVGDTVCIWAWKDERLLERNTLKIKQLLKGGRIIVKYRKMLGFYLIVTVLGLGLSFLNIAYLITSTDDLFRSK